jgi:hypothetical protein
VVCRMYTVVVAMTCIGCLCALIHICRRVWGTPESDVSDIARHPVNKVKSSLSTIHTQPVILLCISCIISHSKMSTREPLDSSLYLSPAPRYDGDTDSERSVSPEPDSPSASTFLRTAATLDGLARQLGDLSQGHSQEPSIEDDTVGRCCCGASSGSRACSTIIERDKMEERMKLSGGKSRSAVSVCGSMGRD